MVMFDIYKDIEIIFLKIRTSDRISGVGNSDHPRKCATLTQIKLKETFSKSSNSTAVSSMY